MKLSTPALATVALSTSLVTANSGSPSAPFSNSTVNVAGNHVTTSTIQLTSVLTNVVSAYTTYVPYPTTFVEGTQTYTVTEATTLTISDCPCTRKTTYTTSFTTVCSGEATVEVAANGHVLATGTAAHGTGSGILQQAKSSATTTLEQTNSANGVKVDARLWMGVVVSGLVSMGVMAGLV